MTSKEAYQLIKQRNDDIEVVNCYEYKTVFVFQTIPKAVKGKVDPTKMLGNLSSVNKSTGEIRGFTPFNIPKEEYLAGVQVFDYE